MNVLTFDVEDWYHPVDPEPANWLKYEDRIVGSVRSVLSILAAKSVRATFFVLGYVAEHHPELVREIHDQGHEIASHGYWHRFVYRQTREEFSADVRRSIELLTSITGRAIEGYRAPYFSITAQSLWAVQELAALKLRYDSSIHPVHNPRYGIPSAPRLAHRVHDTLVELPVSTFPIGKVNIPCGGGAYFRLLPWRVTRSLLRRLARRGEPIVFYLHPWELDPGQPRIPMASSLRWRHYWGLSETASRLARLLDEFPFGTAREALAA